MTTDPTAAAYEAPPMQPQEIPTSRQQVPPAAQEIDAEAGSLIPVVTSILAAYLAYRSTRGAITGPWHKAAQTLGLTAIAGGVLTALAARGIVQQQQSVGRSGDELWEHADRAVIAGRDAGIRVLVETLRSLPEGPRAVKVRPTKIPDGARTNPNTTPAFGAPTTGRTGEGIQPSGPTAGVAPVDPAMIRLLATQVARAVVEGAQNEAAALAGWHKRWHTRKDQRVRPTHAYLEGVSVPAGGFFTTLNGDKIKYPHDPAAPIEETVRCRCALTWHRSAPKKKQKIVVKT